MRIAVALTEKLMYQWPLEYWVELIHKLTVVGHTVCAYSDEPHISISDQNPLLQNRLCLPDSVSEKEIAGCDLFIGPPLKYYEMAKRNGVRAIGLLGATFRGEGVKTPMSCGGCLDQLGPQADCFWGDESCYYEITPNDVIAAI
jgi:hypothetical protein